jgi:hypothetical protein
MTKSIDEFLKQYVQAQHAAAPPYALLYFDHLYAEYQILKPIITAPEVISRLDELYKRRGTGDPPLTWNDIYMFELELLLFLPPESLVRKVQELRARYRSIAGHAEYDTYLATKPPDLAALRVLASSSASAATMSPPAQFDAIIVSALREDIKYLLSEIYLSYALMPLQEGVRAWLTRKVLIWMIVAVTLVTLFIVLNLAGNLLIGSSFYRWTRGSNIGVVVAAGVLGSLVSMLQRIQSAPTEGDALFNVAALASGWRWIYVVPWSGAIFASLLFVLFAGGVLKGTVFPEVYTPPKPRTAAAPAAASAPTPMTMRASEGAVPPADSASAARTPTGGPLPSATGSPTAARTPVEASPAAKPSPSVPASSASPVTSAGAVKPSPPKPVISNPEDGPTLTFSRFLGRSGPVSGLTMRC